MEATFKIKESEFDYAFFKKLKALFRGQDLEIDVKTINLYPKQLNAAIEDVEHNRNLVEFTIEEYDNLVHNLKSK